MVSDAQKYFDDVEKRQNNLKAGDIVNAYFNVYDGNGEVLGTYHGNGVVISVYEGSGHADVMPHKSTAMIDHNTSPKLKEFKGDMRYFSIAQAVNIFPRPEGRITTERVRIRTLVPLTEKTIEGLYNDESLREYLGVLFEERQRIKDPENFVTYKLKSSDTEVGLPKYSLDRAERLKKLIKDSKRDRNKLKTISDDFPELGSAGTLKAVEDYVNASIDTEMKTASDKLVLMIAIKNAEKYKNEKLIRSLIDTLQSIEAEKIDKKGG